MIYEVNLKKTGEKWEFYNEVELENFLWFNLPSLLNLQPLAKQYAINGQFCDILAIDNQQRLVILELKNTEDRYVVQQITRYYDSLVEAKPFSDKINYDNDIVLLVIAPSYHRDNLIDKKHSRLKVEFIQFEIIEERLYSLSRYCHWDTSEN